jgi:hypothetical protein
MFRWLLVLTVGATATVWMGAATASREPTVAQIRAAVAARIAHSHNFVLATSGVAHLTSSRGRWQTWIDLKTGASRSIGQSQSSKLATVQVVTREPHNPTLVKVTDTKLDCKSRTWTRSSRKVPLKKIRPVVTDPLAGTETGLQFMLLDVESVDGQQAYHLRSSYFTAAPNRRERWDVWISTAQDDLRTLPRTSTTLALVEMAIPSGFRQAFVSS